MRTMTRLEKIRLSGNMKLPENIAVNAETLPACVALRERIAEHYCRLELQNAASRGDLETLTTLLLRQSVSPVGTTAMDAAAQGGHKECALLLYRQGALFSSVEAAKIVLGEERSPMHRHAATPGHGRAVLMALVSAGASVVAKDSEGKTPLDLAAQASNEEAYPVLIGHGAHSVLLNHIITSVDLSNLGLQELPMSLLEFPNLTSLPNFAVGNPLTTVPDSVVVKGTFAGVMSYLKEIKESGGKTLWDRTKVLVLGKEGVGKTHLMRALQGVSYTSNQSTNGVDVNTFILKGTTKVTWFDFGGQEVFYPTHQFFLTAQCVYLIVFRLDDPEEVQRQRVLHWLRVVAEFARDPRRPVKIIVVGTHLDALQDSKQAAAACWAKLTPLLFNRDGTGVAATLSVSCKKGTGMRQLKQVILQTIEDAGLGTQWVPRTYITVWAHLERLLAEGVQTLPLDQLRVASLNEIQVSAALRFLRDAGRCFYDESLNLVVTDLQWLADLFREVVSFYSGVKDGVVTLAGLRRKKYTDDEVKARMKLLERFEVAFPRVEEDTWVVPSMLKEARVSQTPAGTGVAFFFFFFQSDESQKNHAFFSSFSSSSFLQAHCKTAPSATPSYEHVFELGAKPFGAMGRFIVRLQSRKELRFLDMWRGGMLVEILGGTQVGSIVLDDDKTANGDETTVVRVRVSSWTLRASPFQPLIQVLTETCASALRDMFARSRIGEKPYRELVACPHCLRLGGNVTWLPKEQCAQLVVENVTTFQCGASDAVVEVRELRANVMLGQVETFDETAFVVEPPFAAGGFGVVSRARMIGKDVLVVVKELNRAKAQAFLEKKTGRVEHQQQQQEEEEEVDNNGLAPLFDREAFDEFQHEAVLMSKLRHDNIVRLHGLILNPLRLVMEYCAIGDLYHVLEKQTPIWGGPVPLDDPSATIPPICFKILKDIAKVFFFPPFLFLKYPFSPSSQGNVSFAFTTSAHCSPRLAEPKRVSRVTQS